MRVATGVGWREDEAATYVLTGRAKGISVARERPPRDFGGRPGGAPSRPPAAGAEPASTPTPEPSPDPNEAPTAGVDPTPDPFDDAEALEALGDRIVTLAADLAAAEQRFLLLVAQFARRRGWELEGHRSCAHWLSFRTGHDLRTAREKVRVAEALETLPRVAEAMGHGELSYSKVRALARLERVLAADPEAEREMVDLARDLPVQDLERFVRARKKGSRADEAVEERLRHGRRRLTLVPDEDGMYEVRGKLTPEAGAMLQRALEAASDALFREEAGAEETSEKQRRADAVGLLAEWALSAGFGVEEETEPHGLAPTHRPAEDGSREPDEDGAPPAPEGSNGTADGSREPRPPVSGVRAERYQVLVHVDPDTLSAHQEPGRSNLEDGTRLAAETSRRLACDASVVRMIRGPEGEVLDVGRKTRTVPPALRRALEVRDQGCRFPGCGLRFTDAHHVEHWSDGGKTDMKNVVLLCRFHHRKVHEEGWRMAYNAKDDTALFFGPRGQVRAHRPDLPEGDHRPEADSGAQRLVRSNRGRGVHPDGWTASPRYRREEDRPWEAQARTMETLDRAEDALDWAEDRGDPAEETSNSTEDAPDPAPNPAEETPNRVDAGIRGREDPSTPR